MARLRLPVPAGVGGAIGNCVLSLKECMFSESKRIKEGPSFRDHCEHFDVAPVLPNFFCSSAGS